MLALWVTNRERHRRFIEAELLPAWGLRHVGNMALAQGHQRWATCVSPGTALSHNDAPETTSPFCLWPEASRHSAGTDHLGWKDQVVWL